MSTKQYNKKLYFSGPIQGIQQIDPNFSWAIVQYIKSLGYDVLSEHVAGRTKQENTKILLEKTGIDRTSEKESWWGVYKVDMNWVDEADSFVAVVDGPSHGVGMEIMRALLKPQRGLNETSIICLVHQENLNKLSWMIRGVPVEQYPNFHLETYTNIDNAKSVLENLLAK